MTARHNLAWAEADSFADALSASMAAGHADFDVLGVARTIEREAGRTAAWSILPAQQPVAIDLFCGRGGWAAAFLARGYRVIGFDIKRWRKVDAAYRIAREFNAPLVLENVRGLQKFHGVARHHFGSFYFWGDGVPALLPHCPRWTSLKSNKRSAINRAHIPAAVAEWMANYHWPAGCPDVFRPGHAGRSPKCVDDPGRSIANESAWPVPDFARGCEPAVAGSKVVGTPRSGIQLQPGVSP